MPTHARDSAQHGPPPAEGELVPRVSVIVPVFNEVETVAEVVQRALSLDLDLEVIVVDDGSIDGTDEALDSLPADPRLVVHRLPANLGKVCPVKPSCRRLVDQARNATLRRKHRRLENLP